MKLLPIASDIGMCSRLNYAYMLSILKAYPQAENWLMDHYYELYSVRTNAETVRIGLNLYDASDYSDVGEIGVMLNESHYTQEELYGTDIISLIKQHIDNDQYVVAFVDEYYLPNAQLGNYTHFLHEELIYGYNENYFYALGMNSQRHYGEIIHTFSDFEYAYEMGNVCEIHGNILWARDHRVIAFALEDKEYMPDIPSIKAKLHVFLQGKMKSNSLRLQ